MIAIIYLDNLYLKWANIYLKSLEMFEPDVDVVVYGWNISKGTARKLREYPNVIEVIPKRMERDEEKSKMWKFQITCAKGGLLLETMKRYPREDLFMITDIDLLFRASLDTPRTIMKYYDIGFCMNLMKDKSLKGMGGMIFTKNTEVTRDFWRRYHKIAMKGKLYRNKDQKTLALMFEQYMKSNKLKFYLIGYSDYLNASECDHAKVWSCHKSRHGKKADRIEDFEKELNRLHKLKMEKLRLRRMQERARKKREKREKLYEVKPKPFDELKDFVEQEFANG
jgi:hypothetical protein